MDDPSDCACTEEGPDGYYDLTLKFSRQAIRAAIEPVPPGGTAVELTVTGELLDGTPFEATDCIWIVPLPPPPPPKDPARQL